MRYFYSILFYLLTPFLPFYLKRRAKKNSNYNLFWHERFGINLTNEAKKPIIWLHAVSVGETRAMQKLVKLLEENFSNHQILITQMTPTGRNTAKTLYPKAKLHYLPYDLPHAMANFYKTFKPVIGIIMETEIWPNLAYYATYYKIPLYLVNARLSDKSFNSYHKVKFFIRLILNKFNGILCQDQITANNFANLGYNKTLPILGNTKFDIVIDEKQYDLAKYLSQNLGNKKVVVFASTRDGEEQQIINTITKDINYLIIIIPRHPERFNEVECLLQKKGIAYQKRSDNQPVKTNIQVLLGDSMGEMFAYYFMADLAVIGGSFNNYGGQNLIEPLQLSKPVIFGPSMDNFATIAANALAQNCAIQVPDVLHCFEQIKNLFKNQDQYLSLVTNSKSFVNGYQGASQKIFAIVSKHLKK